MRTRKLFKSKPVTSKSQREGSCESSSSEASPIKPTSHWQTPLPKRPGKTYSIFNAEFVAKYRKTMLEQGHKPTVQEGFKQASKLWKLMTPLQKKQYSEKAQLQKSLYEARLVEREQLGYFTFPDGSLSTDPVNKDRVNPCEKYPEVTVSYERSPVLSKTASPQGKSLFEAAPFPKEKATRVKSAYNYFAMHLFATSRNNGFKITMKEVAA